MAVPPACSKHELGGGGPPHGISTLRCAAVEGYMDGLKDKCEKQDGVIADANDLNARLDQAYSRGGGGEDAPGGQCPCHQVRTAACRCSARLLLSCANGHARSVAAGSLAAPRPAPRFAPAAVHDRDSVGQQLQQAHQDLQAQGDQLRAAAHEMVGGATAGRVRLLRAPT